MEARHFCHADEAIAACKKLVDENLLSMLKNKPPGMTATELYELYVMFGDDPSVFAPSGVNGHLHRMSSKQLKPSNAWGIAPVRTTIRPCCR